MPGAEGFAQVGLYVLDELVQAVFAEVREGVLGQSQGVQRAGWLPAGQVCGQDAVVGVYVVRADPGVAEEGVSGR